MLGLLTLDTAFPRIPGDVGAADDLGAIVLECGSMPPYRAAVEAAMQLPVFDAVQFITWLYAGIARAPPRYALTDLW